jgi:hypothetical protein
MRLLLRNQDACLGLLANQDASVRHNPIFGLVPLGKTGKMEPASPLTMSPYEMRLTANFQPAQWGGGAKYVQYCTVHMYAGDRVILQAPSLTAR